LRERLINEGWPSWNKKDFFNFIKMAETYSRAPDSFSLYQVALPQKIEDEIKQYAKAFWKNY
jgi:SWI/SNF-related matrix-associated actin-dependent regulator of chromatin subfamily A member 5